MTQLLTLDSAARFSAATARRMGVDVGARYINQTFTRNELQDYLANGLILLPIYEEDGRPGDNDNIPEQADYEDGLRQGRNAYRLLQALGIPEYGCAFTDDVSGQPYDSVKVWAKGVRDGFPNYFLFYGPTHIGDQLVDEGIADGVWKEGAYSFSKPGYQPRHLVGVQYPPPYTYVDGVACDRNTFFDTPWLPGSRPQAPTSKDDDDMGYAKWDNADKDAFWSDFLYHLSGASTVQGNLPSAAKDQGWSTVGDVMEQLTSDAPNHIRRAVNDIFRKTVDPNT